MEPPSVGDDRARLAEFLSDVQGLLGSTLDEHPDWFRTELHDPLRAAWSELQPSFEMASRYITLPPDSRLLDAQLAHAGLTDAQGDLKHKGFRFSFERFLTWPSKVGLKSVLGWVNIILGSLAGIVPGGDAIKEYKEAVEQAVEDSEGEQPPEGDESTAPLGPRSRENKTFTDPDE